ncbi:MAG: VanZ family protein [Flavobacteriales bacterium]|jgi:VanZ family protein|nr:VanZ family protein [Flavobacteriales bacterium]MBK7249123.1 VanZ family protein [Flavobacteriales bacterium]MBK7285687.1 VanZ family protein [Flavobacteriales bacterium]MBK9058638.1 VanZ family protein [Flavobacteriales bacterium]MBK9599849.1 VanZ family protein [Flavobacteriales bacterium]
MRALIRRHAWLPATLWAVAVLVLTLMPGRDVPAWPWAEQVQLDKFVHAFLFGMQSLLLGLALASMRWRFRIGPRALGAVLAIAYGGVIELLQQAMGQGRQGDVLDLLADAAGALFGYGLLSWRVRR